MAVRCLRCMKEYEDGVTKCPHCGYVEGKDEDEQCYLPPRTILKGRYMIGCSLGSGGFGVTYVAWDSLLEKKVAIKEYLPSELATRTMGNTQVTVHDPECQEKYNAGMKSFLDESRRLAKFNNVKGIVRIFDCFDENGTAYIVMECLEGKTLQQMIKERKKLPFKEVLPLFIDVLEALEVVHEAGMMHRDIAPDNIFACNDGTAKLIDFGAARYMTTTHSRSLSMILKIGYAPIEQYTKKGNQGSWTDIYAVAASLYHAITGIVPPDSYDRVEEDKLKRPSLMARNLPKHAETAILNALNIIETNRTQTAKQFADELKGDIDVERIREKIHHEDTGRIAKWMKYTAAGIAGFIALLGILFVATGGRLFRLDGFFVPEGMARVPHVINESVSDADMKIAENSLRMVIGERVTDSFFENNYVILQNPRQGDLAYIGTAVNVTASMKPDQLFVPDLTCFTQDAARLVLEEAGFYVVVEEVEDNQAAPGSVIKQNPAGNSMAYEGQTVKLTVCKSTSPQRMNVNSNVTAPNYVGKSLDQARKDALGRKIFIAVAISEYSDTVPKGQIMAQSVNPGDKMSGSILYVSVSLGKKTIAVPNLYYLSEEEAKAKIESCLLTTEIKYVESKLVKLGCVVKQNPLPGKSISPEGKVTIYVSTGSKVSVPNVVGMEQKEAQEKLFAAGLGYTVTFANSSTVPKGQVMQQSIAAGESVSQGTIVTITVSSGNDVIPVRSVSITESTVNLDRGATHPLRAEISPKNATTTGVKWTSSNPSIVSVDAVGQITGIAEGTATVTVTTIDGGYTAQCKVTVTKKLQSFTVQSEPNKKNYFYNESADYSGLSFNALYTDGIRETISWNDPTVKMSGFDSSKAGDVAVTATYGGKSARFSLHIYRLYKIETNKPNCSFKRKASKPTSYDGLIVTAYYDNTTTIYRPVTGYSTEGFNSDKSGTVSISVLYSEAQTVSSTFTITILGDLTITGVNSTMDNGVNYTLSVQRDSEDNTDNYSYTWSISSSPNGAISIEGDKTGTSITVKAGTSDAGTATVTVKDQFGSSGNCTLSAYGPWSTWEINKPVDTASYAYEEKNVYQQNSREEKKNTNSYESGWTKINEEDTSHWSEYGTEQGPLDYDPSTSDERIITTRTSDQNYQVPTGKYHYSAYREDGHGQTWCLCIFNDKGKTAYYVDLTTETRLKPAGTSHCEHGSRTIYTSTGTQSSNVRWWFNEEEVFETKTRKLYYYKERYWISETTYTHERWSGWSDWIEPSDGRIPAENDNLKINPGKKIRTRKKP